VAYLTEDDGSGPLYRFRPSPYGDLSAGELEPARVSDGAVAGFLDVLARVGNREPTRRL